MKRTKDNRTIAVLGLGSMGSALADRLLASGYRLLAWNRTPEKTRAIVERGAIAAQSAEAAIEQAEAAIVCVADYGALQETLQGAAVAGTLANKPLAQLTGITPDEARRFASWCDANRVELLEGSILGMPVDVAKQGATIVCSGASARFADWSALLAVFGEAVHASEEAGAAYDLAEMTYASGFGLTLGFLHGAAMAEARGISLETYARVAISRMPGLAERVATFTPLLARRDYAARQASLTIWTAAFGRCLDSSRRLGVDVGFPEAVMKMLQDTIDAGHGDDEITAVFEMLRSKH